MNKPRVSFTISKRYITTWLGIVFLTLPHLNPAYLQTIPLVESIMNGWRMFSFVVILFCIFIRRKISRISIAICIWEAFLFITTLLNHGNIYQAAAEAFSVISIVLLYDMLYLEGVPFLSAQLFCFELAIYINLITEFLYKDGMYLASTYPPGPNWFLGYYNGYTKYIIPALLFACLYYEKTRKKGRLTLLVIVVAISDIKVFAGGFTVLLFAMAVAYAMRNRTVIFNYYSYWAIHVIFIISVFVFKIQDLFFWLLEGVLGKMSSYLARLNIWDTTLKLIKRSLLIGHGIQDKAIRIAEVGRSVAIHSHNLLLEILYQGGIVGLCLWCVIVIVAGKYVYRNRNTAESKIIATAFLGWCIATLVEPFTSPFLMGMFVIAYHSNRGEERIQSRAGHTVSVNGHIARRTAQGRE